MEVRDLDLVIICIELISEVIKVDEINEILEFIRWVGSMGESRYLELVRKIMVFLRSDFWNKVER